MQNGLIVEDHRIIALDLKYTLSRDYNIVGIVSRSDEAFSCKNTKLHFILMDTDIRGSFQELGKILSILKSRKSKIILLTSEPQEMLHPTFPYSHIIYKPYSREQLFKAIEH